jgi:hypothetical protein
MKVISIYAIALGTVAVMGSASVAAENREQPARGLQPELVTPVFHKEDPWQDFRFLIGTWVSEGSPEKGSGTFSLEPDLHDKVLVRRNVAYPAAAKDRPPQKHEDLMVIYWDGGGKQFRASYFDSEGHVIQYSVALLPANKGLVFVSEPDASKLRFRLTYTKAPADLVDINFAIAPPGPGDRFKTYLEGTVKRK